MKNLCIIEIYIGFSIKIWQTAVKKVVAIKGGTGVKSVQGGDRGMNITDIRVRKVNSTGKMKAVVSITLDDCFVVHDIKVIEGQEKLFIAMPSRKTPEGEFKDIAHPINTETRELLETKILAAYEEALLEAPEDSEEE